MFIRVPVINLPFSGIFSMSYQSSLLQKINDDRWHIENSVRILSRKHNKVFLITPRKNSPCENVYDDRKMNF